MRTVLSIVLETRLYIPLGRFLAMDLEANKRSSTMTTFFTHLIKTNKKCLVIVECREILLLVGRHCRTQYSTVTILYAVGSYWVRLSCCLRQGTEPLGSTTVYLLSTANRQTTFPYVNSIKTRSDSINSLTSYGARSVPPRSRILVGGSK